MFRQQRINGIPDFFKELSARDGKCVYFYRISGYNRETADFIERYYESARRRGVVIEGRIANPTEQNLSYYGEIMGMDFQMSETFLDISLKKWLPRMNDEQRSSIAASMYDFFLSMKKEKKTEGMLKNAYIKFMCWLYYKFERMVNLLGENQVPKILYEGEVSRYELMLLTVLCHAGCDVVLLQYQGDGAYSRLDADDRYSFPLVLPGMQAFPEGFSLAGLREQQKKKMERERLYGAKPQIQNATNVWMDGEVLLDLQKAPAERGTDPGFFYNGYCQINGVWDKLTYLNELYQFYQGLKAGKRNIVVTDGPLMPPMPEEICKVPRRNYRNVEEMLMDLSANLRYPANLELQRLMVKANKGNALEFPLSEEMMRWLIEQGIDINYVDQYGYTPLLYHAGRMSSEKQAIALVKLGADITATQGLDRETVMHVAVKTGNLELVKCLIQAGADAEVTSRSGETPLERAFHWARTFDLIKLAPVAEYLIGIGVPVTDKIRTYMRSAAEDIEFRRKDMSPDIMPELDRAMESLYGLLGVAPVPRRVEYDGTSPIVIHEKRWQKQHGELWNLLVPGSGHAGTVQGEVIRISGKLAYEILDNGCCNWDSDFKSMANALYRYICMGTPLDADEQREFAGLINGIKNADETDINRLTELSVKWVTLNLNPMAVGKLDYKR